MITCAALLMLSQVAEPASRLPTEWVVKDVIDNSPRFLGGERSWGSIHPLGDPDRDGKHSFYVEGQEDGSSSHADVHWLVQDLTTHSLDEYYISINSPNYYLHFPSRSFREPLLALLAAPGEIRLAMATTGPHVPQIPVADYPSGALRGWLAPPPPPVHHWLAVPYFRAIHPVNDIDGDGYDDLLWVSGVGTFYDSAVVHGLVNGKTLRTVWQRYQRNHAGLAPVYSISHGGPSDLDGDRVPDLIQSAFFYDRPFTGVYQHMVFALSGATGATIWERKFPVYGSPSALVGMDCTGDGVRDVFVLGTSTWDLLDGLDGSIVWSIPKADVGTLLAPGYQGFYPPQAPGVIAHFNGHDDTMRFTIPVTAIYSGWPSVRQSWIELEAETGQLIGNHILVENLKPWSSDALMARMDRQIPRSVNVGDLDRDGLNDLVQRAYAPAWDLPSSSGLATQLLVLGPKTLNTNEAVVVNGQMRGSLWIPSGGGLRWRLFASTQFEGDDGHLLDGWNTHLGRSALLNSTLTVPAAGGRLDSEGRADFQVDLSRWPLAPGQTIYWKAVLRRAGNQDQVHTISTLGKTLILP